MYETKLKVIVEMESGVISDKLMEHLDSLPEAHKLILSIRIYEKLTFEETARLMDVPQNKVEALHAESIDILALRITMGGCQ